jgi:hypothetical protein
MTTPTQAKRKAASALRAMIQAAVDYAAAETAIREASQDGQEKNATKAATRDDPQAGVAR